MGVVWFWLAKAGVGWSRDVGGLGTWISVLGRSDLGVLSAQWPFSLRLGDYCHCGVRNERIASFVLVLSHFRALAASYSHH